MCLQATRNLATLLVQRHEPSQFFVQSLLILIFELVCFPFIHYIDPCRQKNMENLCRQVKCEISHVKARGSALKRKLEAPDLRRTRCK